MSRVLGTLLGALLILGAVVTAYSLFSTGLDVDAPEAPPGGNVIFLEGEATPRGLAAGVIDHLGDRTVTSIAATGQGGLAVVVETDDPAVASVSVFVGPSTDGPATCGSDDGFTSVFCSTEGGPLAEVVTRDPGSGRAPTVIGRFNDEFRGDVLVEVHGDSDAGAVVDLVRDLVADDELGLFTSEDRNQRGQALDVGRLELGSSIRMVS